MSSRIQITCHLSSWQCILQIAPSHIVFCRLCRLSQYFSLLLHRSQSDPHAHSGRNSKGYFRNVTWSSTPQSVSLITFLAKCNRQQEWATLRAASPTPSSSILSDQVAALQLGCKQVTINTTPYQLLRLSRRSMLERVSPSQQCWTMLSKLHNRVRWRSTRRPS